MTTWAGRVVAFATRHGKAAQVAPALAPLGVRVHVADEVDTDRWGTFDGAVRRLFPALDVARAKADAALAAVPEADFGLGSEGSFGPRPDLPWLACDDELLVLRARVGGLELVAREVSLETNWRKATLRSWGEVEVFADAVGFPGHGLLLEGARVDSLEVVAAALEARGEVTLAADARAHVNPTRQRVIARAAEQLAKLMAWRCPSCARPGFVAREPVPGLRCRECGAPTRQVKARVATCLCGASRREVVEGDADPRFCDACNP